jgi:hypothetical protein
VLWAPPADDEGWEKIEVRRYVPGREYEYDVEYVWSENPAHGEKGEQWHDQWQDGDFEECLVVAAVPSAAAAAAPSAAAAASDGAVGSDASPIVGARKHYALPNTMERVALLSTAAERAAEREAAQPLSARTRGALLVNRVMWAPPQSNPVEVGWEKIRVTGFVRGRAMPYDVMYLWSEHAEHGAGDTDEWESPDFEGCLALSARAASAAAALYPRATEAADGAASDVAEFSSASSGGASSSAAISPHSEAPPRSPALALRELSAPEQAGAAMEFKQCIAERRGCKALPARARGKKLVGCVVWSKRGPCKSKARWEKAKVVQYVEHQRPFSYRVVYLWSEREKHAPGSEENWRASDFAAALKVPPPAPVLESPAAAEEEEALDEALDVAGADSEADSALSSDEFESLSESESESVSFLLCTVTLYANLAHSLTRSP